MTMEHGRLPPLPPDGTITETHTNADADGAIQSQKLVQIITSWVVMKKLLKSMVMSR